MPQGVYEIRLELSILLQARTPGPVIQKLRICDLTQKKSSGQI